MIITVRDVNPKRFCDCPIFMQVKVKINQPETEMLLVSRDDPKPYFNDDDGQLDGYEGGFIDVVIHIKGSKMIPIKEFNYMYNEFMINNQISRTSDLYDEVLSEVVSATEI